MCNPVFCFMDRARRLPGFPGRLFASAPARSKGPLSRPRSGPLAVLLVILSSAPCTAHPFNGSFELDGNAPASSFGAASGQTGYWNSLTFFSAVVRDLNGIDHGARLSITNNQGFGYSGGIDNNVATTGDIEYLMDDYFEIGAPPFFSPGYDIHISGLDPGTYDLFTYAWMGTWNPGQTTSVEVTSPVTVPAQVVGGAWNGLSFTHLITHAVHRVTIATGQDLVVHVAPAALAGCVNGFQLVPASPVPADETSWGRVKATYR